VLISIIADSEDFVKGKIEKKFFYFFSQNPLTIQATRAIIVPSGEGWTPPSDQVAKAMGKSTGNAHQSDATKKIKKVLDKTRTSCYN
jgi:hypothetical protein